jgi:hypothetical protein
MLGRVLERARFEGTSKETYVIKKTMSTSEYWLEVSLRSVSIPAIFALPMLAGISLFRLRGVYVCMCLLRPVHVTQQVHEPYRRQQEEINLPDQFLLLHGEFFE